MSELELKLQVPHHALAAVEREVAVGGARRMRLQAVYFDTSDRRLGAAGLALRLRKEGRRWVQTLKSGEAHSVEREEHNVPLGLSGVRSPAPDPALHAGTGCGARLAELLAPDAGGSSPRLVALYRTDIWRRTRSLRTRRGVVELALDCGEILAEGADGVTRRWPVCELEIEHQRGAPCAVTDVAARWAARHGLWVDTRSKAERGDRTSRGLGPGDPVAVVKAQPLRWRKGMAPDEAWRALLGSVLAQALPNWSECAAHSRSPEPVHQLRVALRRLRSGQRFVAGWPGVREPAWSERAVALFGRLGADRDRDVLSLGPQREIDADLAALGEPPLPPPGDGPASAWTDADRVLHGGLFIELLAEWMSPLAAQAPGAPPQGARPEGADPTAEDPAEPAAPPKLRALCTQRLQAWHRALRRDARRFEDLDDESRHGVRKRLKRLRYGVEFSAGLYGRERVETYLEALREAQERLGEYNDLCVAMAAWQPLAAQHPRAYFALGWLSAQRAAVLARCSAALKRWRKAPPFWDRP